MHFLLSPSSVCTNLWGLKVGAPPVADAVINHPVLFHTILPSKDLKHKQMLMNLLVHNHQSNKKLKLCSYLSHQALQTLHFIFPWIQLSSGPAGQKQTVTLFTVPVYIED